MLDAADYVLEKYESCVIYAGCIAHNRFFLGFDFLEVFLPPDRIGFVQGVDDDRRQIGKSLQVNLKLVRNYIPAPVVSNAIMHFIELESKRHC